ncbi:acyl-CoA synthetase (AMP-forming)/AMP-acid ligase II [Pseudoduganella flava]|uniref:AMP-binding protein n=1 Tax=Pseudoduganella flava TaxID=871742 RepID=A0A562PZV6_9BURK|nr:AMP-binding protein [Pseudoduganella flava]QGZ38515.1 AMP-binding protein [Pseudoduganella flava]TWI49928.1 acyl-CoA synthetase (AMP-forming)/AMP-acid ligase II [Pseudoduganella flava]
MPVPYTSRAESGALPERLAGLLARRADDAPHAPALREAGRTVTYGQLRDAVQSTAETLLALGVRPGDRVLLVAENCVAQVCLLFAAGLCDAWLVNVNARLTAREVDEIRAHSGARVAFYTSDVSPDAAAHGHRHGATAAPAPGGGSWLVGPINDAAVPEPVHADGARQCAALLYTSGTTGRPKGVMLSHRSLLYVAAVSSALRGLVPRDRAYGALPISHVYGMTSVLLGTLYAGACLHLVPRFAAAELLRAVVEDGLTIVQGVPAMYTRLLEVAPAPVAARLRFLYAGGSPLSPVLKAAVEARFGLPLHNGYGLTECAPTVSQSRLDAPRDDTSVGPPIPGVEVRIAGPDGDPARPGELWVRGPNVMLGYYRAPAETAAVLDADGWLNTGDVARAGPDGALFIVGRTKELIVRSGFNVYPLEVETVLNAHPDVAQSAVVGRPGAAGEEDVIAFAEPRAGSSLTGEALAAALAVHAAAQLAPYKRPARIVVLPALPAGPTGKVLKAALRELACGLSAPGVGSSSIPAASAPPAP